MRMDMKTECTVEIDGHTVQLKRQVCSVREWVTLKIGDLLDGYEFRWLQHNMHGVSFYIVVNSDDYPEELLGVVLSTKKWLLENVETAGLDGFSTLEE